MSTEDLVQEALRLRGLLRNRALWRVNHQHGLSYSEAIAEAGRLAELELDEGEIEMEPTHWAGGPPLDPVEASLM